jgi:hypothetical protein
MKTTTATATAARLKAAILDTLNATPRDQQAIMPAVGEAFFDSGAEARLSGDFVRLMLDMARTALQAADVELEEQAAFYREEAEFEGSDHKPADCREWSAGYTAAAKAHREALTDLADLEKKLCGRIVAANL